MIDEGKSTELLRRIRRYTIAKRRCLVVKYKADTRYSETEFSTHDKCVLLVVMLLTKKRHQCTAYWSYTELRCPWILQDDKESAQVKNDNASPASSEVEIIPS
jgi:thymidine kinase